ncbi:Ubiquitin protein ATG12 [Paragonimus heterotremus]|uniref:Ubiquitin-like protein ATG12 n=1 Tax=Paragonimus heterotremus TaxID=100268 RepID=A0A8J4SLR2_9TREM|nr:Ubiquitin protein ATG12 [Paragonimus heterotremus]
MEETRSSPVTVSPDSKSSAASSASDKVTLLLKATGNAPLMKKKTWSVSRKQTIGWVVKFFRDYIACAPNESFFVYVNQCFAPSMDTAIGPLYDCFSAEGKLLCRNPEVKKYISDCVESIRPHLAHIHELRILIRRPRDSVNASDGFLESLILRFGQINLEFVR